jgi:NAD(P)H-hydrate epimerase
MKPVLTAEELHELDRRAIEQTRIEVLIERAGFAIAKHAVAMLGTAYAKRVLVLAGKGNNGADGRVAARVLARRGARVEILEAREAPRLLPPVDLVIDAVLGTGFRGTYDAPVVDPSSKVLAVDLPSGLDADTGEACGAIVHADRTVTMAALKPGLFFNDGPSYAGEIALEPIGLDAMSEQLFLIEDDDVATMLPRRARATHKWAAASFVLAGSANMSGAAQLCASGALRAGSGMVRLASLDGHREPSRPVEVVGIELAEGRAIDQLVEEMARCKVLVAGPGLGLEATKAVIGELLARVETPIVLDADGLGALGARDGARALLAKRPAPTVLTPHDGEFARLSGAPPSIDRLGDVRALAASFGAAILLKGPTTTVVAPDGKAYLVASGTPALATAGSGDVLAGVIGAFVARGLDLVLAAALGAHVHGRAASRGPREGLVASDLPILVGQVIEELVSRDA